MADGYRGGGGGGGRGAGDAARPYSPREARDQPMHNAQYPPRHDYSLPPPASHGQGPSPPMALPSIRPPHEPRDPRDPYGQHPADPRGYAAYPSAPPGQDRAYSPTGANGYPPGPVQHPPPQHPPTQYSAPPNAHAQHPPPPPPGHYPPPPYSYPAHYGQPPPPAEGYPPPGYYHSGHPGPYYDAYRGLGGMQPTAAPRQRTSIACKYCRKRKIRCSGYNQSGGNGKCTNCDKLHLDCIFQPVSSNSTAFVPVSAVHGPLPPGTPLYGAFGQPLGRENAPGSPGGPHPPAPPFVNSPSDYPAVQSPTAPYQSPDDRRQWPVETDRSSAPYPYVDDDARRRSPTSMISGGTPPTGFPQYAPARYDGAREAEHHRIDPSRAPQPQPQPLPTQSSAQLSIKALLAAPAPRVAANNTDREMLQRLK